ncbi:putative transferase [Helianthus annuus]|nr:putative transferase [Helianthus annuus]
MVEVVVSLESALALQMKFNKSLQAARRTLFGRMIDMLPFPSNGENFGRCDSKLSSTSKGNHGIASSNVLADNNMFPQMKEVHLDSQSLSRSPSPSVKEFRYDELKTATREFSPELLLREVGFGKVFLGWVDENTLALLKVI